MVDCFECCARDGGLLRKPPFLIQQVAWMERSGIRGVEAMLCCQHILWTLSAVSRRVDLASKLG
jgi:hypothetical protein